MSETTKVAGVTEEISSTKTTNKKGNKMTMKQSADALVKTMRSKVLDNPEEVKEVIESLMPQLVKVRRIAQVAMGEDLAAPKFDIPSEPTVPQNIPVAQEIVDPNPLTPASNLSSVMSQLQQVLEQSTATVQPQTPTVQPTTTEGSPSPYIPKAQLRTMPLTSHAQSILQLLKAQPLQLKQLEVQQALFPGTNYRDEGPKSVINNGLRQLVEQGHVHRRKFDEVTARGTTKSVYRYWAAPSQ